MRNTCMHKLMLGTVVVGAGLALGLILPSCKVGPDYQRPPVETPTTFKSATTRDAARSRLDLTWWRMFGDPELTRLEEAALEQNQDLQAAIARVLQARENTRATMSQFYPVVTLDPSAIRSRAPANTSGGRASHSGSTASVYRIPFDLSYEIDLWGRVRRSVEAAQTAAEATVDQVAVVRLTLTADVAQNYFTLRSLDSQIQILGQNLDLYRRQLGLVQKQLDAALVSKIDVLQVQTLLESTQAQQIDLRRQRADIEHALAILLGRPPAAVTLAEAPLVVRVLAIPVGLPSDLLARRPDVASAEQNLASASAQIGVATANFYPVVKLTGVAGFESFDVAHMVDWESRIWALGPSVSVPIFEGGRLDANLAQAKARYDELVATYRSTVLVAFREVEDSLTDLHHRTNQSEAQAKAVSAARESLGLIETQYEQGLANYLQVIDADRTLLTNELAAAQIESQRMVSAVLLIKALGGGWSTEPTTAPSGPATAATTRVAEVTR